MPEDTRLIVDPVNEVCPNFTAAIYTPVRDAMCRENNSTEEKVIANLVEMWTQEHNICLKRWVIQQAEDTAVAMEERQWQQAEAHREEDHQPAGQDNDQVQQDTDKEMLKLNNFNEDKPMPSILLCRPSQYALQKLKQGDYVELWYFSSEGYREAKKEAHSTVDNAFGISRSEELLILRPASTVKASKNVLADHQLPMVEFLCAKNTFLHHAAQQKWPKKHINVLSVFYWNLENHPMHELPNGMRLS